MNSKRLEHVAQLAGDIARWRVEALQKEKDGNKSQAAVLRGWARSAARLADRIKGLPEVG